MTDIDKDVELDLDMITEYEKQFEDEILLMASQRFEAELEQEKAEEDKILLEV